MMAYYIIKIWQYLSIVENKNVESFTIPDGVENIVEYAFGRSSLKEINLPSSIKEI